jgi:hypothetical protein
VVSGGKIKMAAAEFQESLKKILEGSLDPIIAAPIWFIAGALPGPARTGGPGSNVSMLLIGGCGYG